MLFALPRRHVARACLRACLALTSCAIFSAPAAEVLTKEKNVTLSGFGDVLLISDERAEDECDFALGQVEVDLDTAFQDRIYASVAIAYDPQLDSFGLGAFTLDYHLFGTDGPHFRRGGPIDHSGIIAGRFDVPFGIDWQVLPSIDRHLVSTPLVVDRTHDSWSDVGAQVYASIGPVDASLYATNGWDYDAAHLLSPEQLADTMVVSSVIAEAGFGARLAVRPLEGLELGGSVARIDGKGKDVGMWLIGGDLQFTQGVFRLRGEYIHHTIDLAGFGEHRNHGLYLQGMFDFGLWFLVGRLDDIECEDRENVAEMLTEPNRISAGVGLRLIEGCQLRGEYQIHANDVPDRAMLQVVVGY